MTLLLPFVLPLKSGRMSQGDSTTPEIIIRIGHFMQICARNQNAALKFGKIPANDNK